MLRALFRNTNAIRVSLQSQWTVQTRWLCELPDLPAKITIPSTKVSMKAVRSSGAGGQHVNTTSSCVELRFSVDEADWLPDEVKERLKEQQPNRINKLGELIVTAQDERTQTMNRKLALARMQDMIDAALIRPKDREMYEGISEDTKQFRKEEKRYRSKIKKGRKVSKRDM